MQNLFLGPSAGFLFERLAVRDFAALQLADKLGLAASAEPSWKAADWESLRTEVRDALANRNEIKEKTRDSFQPDRR